MPKDCYLGRLSPFRLLLIFLSINLLFFCGAVPSLAKWTNTGPYGGYVFSLAIDPVNPQNVYAGTNGAVFKSINGGAGWVTTNTGVTEVVNTAFLTVDPVNPLNVYAGTSIGVYKSADGGLSWIKKTPD